MVVCHCLAVNDKLVRRMIKSGAASAEEIASSCGAGARCGGCIPLIEDLLEREALRQAG